MKPSIGITPEHLTSVSNALNSILADEFVLYAKTRGAHWNVEGIDFYNKHLFFEKQYEELDEIMDAVAERIRVLGHYAAAKLTEYIELTHLTQDSRQPNAPAGGGGVWSSISTRIRRTHTLRGTSMITLPSRGYRRSSACAASRDLRGAGRRNTGHTARRRRATFCRTHESGTGR